MLEMTSSLCMYELMLDHADAVLDGSRFADGPLVRKGSRGGAAFRDPNEE